MTDSIVRGGWLRELIPEGGLLSGLESGCMRTPILRQVKFALAVGAERCRHRLGMMPA